MKQRTYSRQERKRNREERRDAMQRNYGHEEKRNKEKTRDAV
jgi:hypothetical protein